MSLSGTVLETVALYKKGYYPYQMAKARGLGIGTIFEHLTMWYATGGDLDINKFVSTLEQSQIIRAIAEAGGIQKLSPIKERLPEEISYDKIKLVAAKIRRNSQKMAKK